MEKALVEAYTLIGVKPVNEIIDIIKTTITIELITLFGALDNIIYLPHCLFVD